MKQDIESRADIELMVNEFYGKVKDHELLGPVFEKVVQGNWQPHLEKMYGFWETIVLNVHSYSGSPFRKHIPLDIHEEHFTAWLSLFHETIDLHFSGKNAEDIKNRSSQMGLMFQYKLKHIKGS